MKFSKKISVDDRGVKKIAAKLSEPIIMRNVRIVEIDDMDVHLDVSKSKTDTLSSVDDLIVDKAKRSKMAWFGKDLNDLTIQSAFRASNQHNIVRVRRCPDTRLFDENNQEITDFPEVGDPVSVAIDLAYIELLKSSIETSYNLVQLRKVRRASTKKVVPSSMFEDDEIQSDDDEEEFEE